jgi:squalene synthase HpnC
MPDVTTSPAAAPPPNSHYENFPVASWLCPPRLRPAVAAVYWFARTADDIADEGDAPAPLRLAQLHAYRDDLRACVAGQQVSARWPQVFGPLAAILRDHRLPPTLLDDLLRAFEQDVDRTAAGQGYADRAELLDYCSRSAHPVGRLLLHLYGITGARELAWSDCICSALQLINFWQDLGLDIPRGRFYLPLDDATQQGIDPRLPPSVLAADPRALALVQQEVRWARALMAQGAPLVHCIAGRAGWELRLVVQGGLRILDKIEAQGCDTFGRRPRLRAWDAPVLLWRSLWM